MMDENIKTKARFKLSTIFLFVNLTVLFLPLFGVIFFRFYENQLVKQTETELISQAAVFSATYKHYLEQKLGGNSYGKEITSVRNQVDDYYTPIEPQASLSTASILPPRPEGIMVERETQFADAGAGLNGQEDQALNIPMAKSSPSAPEYQSNQPAMDQKGYDEKPTEKKQLSPNSPTSKPNSDSEVLTVVGSRVRGRTALDSSVPVDVIEGTNLDSSPSLNMADKSGSLSLNKVMDYMSEEMLPIIIEAQKTTLSGIKILDPNGTVVAGRDEVGLNFSRLPEIQTAMTGEYKSLLRKRISDEPTPPLAGLSRGTGVRLFVAFPIINEDKLMGIVYLSRTPQNILKHIYENREKMALIGLSLLGVTLLLALLTSYTVSKPLNRLIARVKRFTEGENEAIQPMTSPGVKEIELLSKSFSNMALSLNNRTQYIKEFALSVSHEFKTPITSIQGSAELVLEHLDDMDADKKRKFLKNIIMDSDRLKRLINRLLELAKAENFKPSNELTDLQETLKNLVSRYSEFGLTINIENANDYELLMAKEHFETIMVNLFDNALQNKATLVSLKLFSQYGFVAIIVSDNGAGISNANKNKVFDSFFTTKREEGGTGLGLRIVKSLLNAHNGSIVVQDSCQGAEFEITIPVKIS